MVVGGTVVGVVAGGIVVGEDVTGGDVGEGLVGDGDDPGMVVPDVPVGGVCGTGVLWLPVLGLVVGVAVRSLAETFGDEAGCG